MNKKMVIIISVFIIIILGALSLIMINISKGKCITNYESELSNKLNLISNTLNKYNIKSTGEVEVVANYKGAHGENYPAKFNYNYLVDDKIYFENNEYSSIDFNKKIVDIINILKRVDKLDIKKYDKLTKKSNNIIITYDNNYINSLLDTNFNNISVSINMSGFVKKIKDINIKLDDINITVIGKDIEVKYKNNKINLTIEESASYINVNNKLKMNIFNNNTFSIVLNNQVYSLQMLDDGLNIKFNTSAAIYNSLSVSVKYKDITIDKNNESSNYKDNPIIRYLSESDLSL